LGRSRLWRWLNDHGLWLIIQGSLATAAEMVICPKLDEMAMVATNNFPRIDRRKSCGHSGCTELPEQGTPPKNSQGLATSEAPHKLTLGLA